MIPNLEEVKKKGGFNFQFTSKDNKVNKNKWVKFFLNSKEFKISSGGPEKIKVDELFFTRFKEKERVAILWHELYHCKFLVFNINENYSLKKQWAKIVSWFDKENYKKKNLLGEKNLLWIEEFEADKYSALKNGSNNCLNCLYVSKRLYESGIIKYNSKTHPPIPERIKRIKELKQR